MHLICCSCSSFCFRPDSEAVAEGMGRHISQCMWPGWQHWDHLWPGAGFTKITTKLLQCFTKKLLNALRNFFSPFLFDHPALCGKIFILKMGAIHQNYYKVTTKLPALHKGEVDTGVEKLLQNYYKFGESRPRWTKCDQLWPGWYNVTR